MPLPLPHLKINIIVINSLGTNSRIRTGDGSSEIPKACFWTWDRNTRMGATTRVEICPYCMESMVDVHTHPFRDTRQVSNGYQSAVRPIPSFLAFLTLTHRLVHLVDPISKHRVEHIMTYQSYTHYFNLSHFIWCSWDSEFFSTIYRYVYHLFKPLDKRYIAKTQLLESITIILALKSQNSSSPDTKRR